MVEKEVVNLLKTINSDIPDDENLDLLGMGIIDSFDIVNIVAELEEKFHIEIDAEDIVPRNFGNVKGIIELVVQYVNTK